MAASPDKAVQVFKVTAKGVQKATTMLSETGALDVWTHSCEGLSADMQAFADDPAGAMQSDGALSADVLLKSLNPANYESSSFTQVKNSLAAQKQSLKAQLAQLGEFEDQSGDGIPWYQKGLATVGQGFQLLLSAEQMISSLFSLIPFPALPALRMLDFDIGFPHGHLHPPNLIPPATVPVPFPSTGPIIPIPFLSGATQTLINGMPAACCGDMGLGIWCGGYFPLYEVFLGSSNVWIEGNRAGRVLCDVTTHCTFRTPKPKDSPKYTFLGLPISASTNVMIGGFPLPSLMGIAMGLGFKMAFKGLGKIGKLIRKLQDTKLGVKLSNSIHAAAEKLMGKRVENLNIKNKVHNAICAVTGHPVDVAAGKVFTDAVDFELPGPIPLKWERIWFSTSVHDGPIGHGWHHSYDMRLAADDKAVVAYPADGRPLIFPALQPGQSHYNRAERLTLFKDRDGYGLFQAGGLIYRFVPHNNDPADQHLTAIYDRTSQSDIHFYYDHAGRLSGIRDSAGRNIRIRSNALGKIEKIYLPSPDAKALEPYFCAVHYRYDDRGDLIEVRDALNAPFSYAYANHLLVRETNRNGLSFYFEYDGKEHSARCIHTWGDGGIYDHKLYYDDYQKITVVENSLGHKTTYHHDGVLPYKIVDALGHETQTRYDEDYLVLKETDELGRVTIYEYDERGNPIKFTGPDGATVQTEYNEEDLPVEMIDPAGNQWRLEYDERGRLTARIDPLGRRFEYRYGGSLLTAFTDAAGGTTRLEYDPQRNLNSLILSDGTRHRWEYDGLGNLIGTVDPRGNRQQLQYDLLGRVVRAAEPDGNERHLAYDPQGNVVHARDRQYDITFTYQGMNRLASRSQAGITVSFEYNTEENLTAIANEHGRVYRFGLDPTGEVEREMGFDGLMRRYMRDAAGQVVKVERPAGKFSTYEYDRGGRVVTVAHGDGSEERFAYGRNGDLIKAETPEHKVQLERDALGRIIREIQGEHWVASEYNDLGLRVRMTSSMGAEQNITRNQMGDVTGVTFGSQEPYRVDFKRDELGLEIERRLPGGVRSIWQRDKLGRPLRRDIDANGRLLSSREYKWDVNDRLREIKDALKGATVYRHDALGNLAAAQYEDRTIEWRMPDAVGNLFKTRDRSDRKYGPAGQLLESFGPEGTTAYAYDPEGNLIEKRMPDGGIWSYQWNDSGMLVKVIRPDGGEVSFAYDALGRRIEKRFDGKTTHWVWDGNNPLHEWITHDMEAEENAGAVEGSLAAADDIAAKARQGLLITRQSTAPPDIEGTLEAPITWIFEPDTFSPMAKIVGRSRYSILTDHLGTPSMMLDLEGNTVWSADINIYGLLRNLEGHKHACPFRWPGQYEDAETGLYYNRFRYYDPNIGQYMSQDPISLAGGFNLYAYAPDVLGWTDPLGLADDCQWTTLSQNVRAYLNDIEVQTGLKVHPSQRRILANHLRQNQHVRLSRTAGKSHRVSFNNIKDDLIVEWERRTGQDWPRYTQVITSRRSGRVLRNIGDPYDAHHIIENVYEGPHTWWNIHPAIFPNAHQGGIHRSGAPLRTIMP